MKRLAAFALMAAAASQAAAQEPGWNYSPLPGEGDRAAMGCAADSTSAAYACIAVRCEDDYSTGLYVHTSREAGDAGAWRIGVDRQSWNFEAEKVDNSPYGARFRGEVAALIEEIKHGTAFYFDPPDGELPTQHRVGLSGSLYAINQALYFCAPRVVRETEPAEATGSENP